MALTPTVLDPGYLGRTSSVASKRDGCVYIDLISIGLDTGGVALSRLFELDRV
jgi:hypothetical protein